MDRISNPPDLAAFEAAFDSPSSAPEPGQDPDRLEDAVRRRLRGLSFELLVAAALLTVCAAAGLAGLPVGWGMAAFFLLVAVPRRRRERARWRAELEAVESAEELRDLCTEQARRRAAGAALSAVLLAVLAGVYFLTAGVAWLLERPPWPGLAAGGLVMLWALSSLLVRLPLAARELAMLEGERRDG